MGNDNSKNITSQQAESGGLIQQIGIQQRKRKQMTQLNLPILKKKHVKHVNHIIAVIMMNNPFDN
jgi:hypothetical protein